MRTVVCVRCQQNKGINVFARVGPDNSKRNTWCRKCMADWNLLSLENRNASPVVPSSVDIVKSCTVCMKILPPIAFYKNKQCSDGMMSDCKLCNDTRGSKLINSNYIANLSNRLIASTKICSRCKTEKDSTHFSINRRFTSGLAHNCKQCDKIKWASKAVSHDNRIRWLLQRVRSKCNKLNIPFELIASDIIIPSHCPILGIPLHFGKSDKGYTSNAAEGSPSIDRIDPAGGYIKSNIVVISWRANRIKGNATIDELQKLANFYSTLGSISE